MTVLRFSDGMTIDTSGEFRVIHKKDGYYVVGQGMLCPAASQLEGERILRELREWDSSDKKPKK